MIARHQTLSGQSELPLTRVEDSGPGKRHMLTVDNSIFLPPQAVAERESGDLDVIEMSIEGVDLVDGSMGMADWVVVGGLKSVKLWTGNMRKITLVLRAESEESVS